MPKGKKTLKVKTQCICWEKQASWPVSGYVSSRGVKPGLHL